MIISVSSFYLLPVGKSVDLSYQLDTFHIVLNCTKDAAKFLQGAELQVDKIDEDLLFAFGL